MESQDREEVTARSYEPYVPESFDTDEEAGEGATPGASVPARVSQGEFREGLSSQAPESSTFEDHPGAKASEADFASLKFQRENTLLTNAESYAASIREEAQLYVQQLREEVETLNQEAELRYEEAAKVKEAADAEAEKLVVEARAQVETIRAEAHEEGYQAGFEAGMTKRYEEAGVYLERLEDVFKEINQFRRRVAYYTEKDGIRLALMMAKKILQSEIRTNKKVLAKLVASTLSRMEGKGTFRILMSEEDHEFILKARPSLERYLDEDQALTFRVKPDLTPGNIQIETDREIIDMTLESQLFHLERRLDESLAERETVMTQVPREEVPARPAPEAPPAPEETPSGEEG